MFSIGTSDDYVGVDRFKPLRDANGSVVFLEPLSYSCECNIDYNFEPTYEEHEGNSYLQMIEKEKDSIVMCNKIRSFHVRMKR